MKRLQTISTSQVRNDLPDFKPGDTVRVHVRVVEGEKERIQVFEGIVIGIKGSGNSRTFTVRKVSGGVGVERIFPVNTPMIRNIEVTRRGRVRRAKLFYLRDRIGKRARVKERRRTAVEVPGDETPPVAEPASGQDPEPAASK